MPQRALLVGLLGREDLSQGLGVVKRACLFGHDVVADGGVFQAVDVEGGVVPGGEEARGGVGGGVEEEGSVVVVGGGLGGCFWFWFWFWARFWGLGFGFGFWLWVTGERLFGGRCCTRGFLGAGVRCG